MDAAIEHVWKTWVVDHTSEFVRLTIVPVIPLLIIFYSVNAVLMVFNVWPSVSPLERWKIQPHVRESPTKMMWMLLNVVFNQCMSIGLNMLSYDRLKRMGMESGVEGIPHWYTLIGQVVLCAFLYDFLFYCAHRIMHIPFLYRHFHYLHHSSHASIGLTQSYFHPVDFFVSGLAVLIPPLLVSKHIITQVVWNVVLILESLNAHTGYNIPYLPDTRPHDMHHSHPHRPANFGAFFAVWDTLLGTDKEYYLYLEEQEQKRVASESDKSK
eukprot:TRINITY_DN4517_c0_g1_i1.p1 TRINITY_DN4517_c0_g1~~TRINITY_DN4517_c0_g1_i1.p1  ORF type:complete len:268 (-),score=102.63 TRINITY_DN4517_c0_g1_i1:130-933(-)